MRRRLESTFVAFVCFVAAAIFFAIGLYVAYGLVDLLTERAASP